MDYFIEHIKDLSDRSYNKNSYEFSSFLNGEEQSHIADIKNELTFYTLFGGTAGCERQIIRFGDEDEFGYIEDYPIDCVKISPLNKKFSDKFTHRDILGAIMNSGIERDNIGDIFITDDDIYVFVLKKMSSYICDNLTKIKYTCVKCVITDNPPDNVFSNTEEMTVIIASMRIDCIICGVFNLSRNGVNELFHSKKIFVNSALNETNSFIPKTDDIISVRGFGKFIVGEISGNTKKGRIVLNIRKYV